MFILVQRTDTLPEIRTMVNTDHIVAILPVAGGAKTKFYLTTGESWEIGLNFSQALALMRERVKVEAPGAAPATPPEGGRA